MAIGRCVEDLVSEIRKKTQHQYHSFVLDRANTRISWLCTTVMPHAIPLAAIFRLISSYAGDG